MPIGPVLLGVAKAAAPAVIGTVAGGLMARGPSGRAGRATRAINEEISGQRELSQDFLSKYQQQWDFYRDNFQDVDLALIEDVMGARERGPDIGRVSADVASAFERAEEAEGRRQRRFGIDPTSGAAITASGDLRRDAALAEVAGRNIERRQTEEENISRLGGLSALGLQHMGAAQQTGAIGANLRQNVLRALTGEREQHLADAQSAASTVGRIAGALPWGNIFGGSTTPESTSGTYGVPEANPETDWLHGRAGAIPVGG